MYIFTIFLKPKMNNPSFIYAQFLCMFAKTVSHLLMKVGVVRLKYGI